MLIAGFVLFAEATSLVAHFAALEHTVSSTSGRLAHASACETEHSTSEHPAFTPGCTDHVEHDCEVWTLLRSTLLLEVPTVATATPVDLDVEVPEPRFGDSHVVGYAPKQSPPHHS